ncbi:proteasome assembly chaperone family protein [Haladaptatus halobius]|uniref:proteasome assembly chaperone family protein n=1 Tax=Haladaptatus halobius TaxID=2884875 RepID=UPI001D0A8A4B|nr:PAC2 family protein [Haladaptatus halobius]
MGRPTATVEFKAIADQNPETATFIEGLPGHGLVAAIAVDQITQQLGLTHHGSLHSDLFPPVTSFTEGQIQDPVRVYAGETPSVLTLQSDVVLPPTSYRALGKCLREEIMAQFERAVFLVGAPAQSESEVGDVQGVATTDALKEELTAANIPLAAASGLVGGVTGALANDFYQSRIPTMILIVQANPFYPDPIAAQSLIENAVEPLVDFDIETPELEQQADAIQSELEQVAAQYQQLIQNEQASQSQDLDQPVPSMYQ